MANLRQRQIRCPIDIEGPQNPWDDDDDNNEVIIGGRGLHEGTGMGNGEPGSDDDNNDQLPGNPVGGLHGPRGPWVIVDLKDPRNHGTNGSCLHDFVCQMPNFFSKNDEDADDRFK